MPRGGRGLFSFGGEFYFGDATRAYIPYTRRGPEFLARHGDLSMFTRRGLRRLYFPFAKKPEEMIDGESGGSPGPPPRAETFTIWHCAPQFSVAFFDRFVATQPLRDITRYYSDCPHSPAIRNDSISAGYRRVAVGRDGTIILRDRRDVFFCEYRIEFNIADAATICVRGERRF